MIGRVAILGNSGSGKSTLARWLSGRLDAPVLDLDTVAWEAERIAVARAPGDAQRDVRGFCRSRPRWVVEGCYANLVREALAFAPRLVFLNPGAARCQANCRARPWEPHKYPSQAEQNERLPFLLDWVAEYYVRDGEMSLAAHRALYEAYAGDKLELTVPPDLAAPPAELLARLDRQVPGCRS